jgi:NADH:ubiquinone oxidoreductase subunit C
MISQGISLYSILKKAQSFTVTLRKKPLIAIRLNAIEPHLFQQINYLNYTLVDLTANNHPERHFCNTIYYIYESPWSNLYLSVVTRNHGSILTASTVNFSALIAERECSEMFGIIFENHKDLRKLLLDYGATGTPLMKNFPISGFTQISYSSQKTLVWEKLMLSQMFRTFSYQRVW